MPETRYKTEIKYPEGLSGAEKILDNAIITQGEPYEVTDEELAEEMEYKAIEKAEDWIDAIGNLSDAKVFLKRLVRRLIKNGALP